MAPEIKIPCPSKCACACQRLASNSENVPFLDSASVIRLKIASFYFGFIIRHIVYNTWPRSIQFLQDDRVLFGQDDWT